LNRKNWIDEDVVWAFESDPDFHLRERVEKLAEEYNSGGLVRRLPLPSYLDACHPDTIVRRLREVLDVH
jgi:hypothetical protein